MRLNSLFPRKTDRPLIRELASGEPSAQTAIYRKLASSIYPTALRITACPQDAEDAMQEAFLRLFKTACEGTADFGDSWESLTAWLRHTAANCAIDILRRRSLFSPSEPSEADLSDETDLQDDDTEAEIEDIHRAVLGLPSQYRTILSLHLFEGYDYEECAGILGVPEGTVRVKYLRAKRRLLKELKHNEE